MSMRKFIAHVCAKASQYGLTRMHFGIFGFLVALYVGVVTLVIHGLDVRPEDLAAWVGQPVETLDRHTLFNAMPMVKTTVADGSEIRNYVNKFYAVTCTGPELPGGILIIDPREPKKFPEISVDAFNAFEACAKKIRGCDNWFFIREGKVQEFRPLGDCYTKHAVQPEQLFLRPL